MPMPLGSLTLSLRRLAAHPTFALTAIVTLALGMGASTAIYSVAYGVLLRPLPFDHPDQLVHLSQLNARGQPLRFSRANFEDVAEAAHSYRGLARYSAGLTAVVGGTAPVMVTGAWVSDSFLEVLRVAPVLGRTFLVEEHTPGGPAAILISQAFWRQHLEDGSNPLGRTLRLANETYTVVGVMPPGFDFPGGSAFWVSADRVPRVESRTGHNWHVIGRLHDEVRLGTAQQETTAIARHLKAVHGDETWMDDARVVPLRDSLVGNLRPLIALLAGAVAFLLLVSAATVANLLLAQSVTRAHEFAVRQAIGATRTHLLRQLLIENLLLVGLGSALGVWLAHGAIEAVLGAGTGPIPGLGPVTVDLGTVAFTVALAMALAAGLAIVTASRVTGQEPLTALGAGGRGGVGSRGVERMRRGLVVAQIAFTLVLLVGAGLLGQRLGVLLRADPGFPTSGLLVVSATFTRAPLDQGERRSQEIVDIVGRLESLGQVTAAGGINAFPLSGLGSNGQFLEMRPGDRLESFEDVATLAQLPGRTGDAEYRVATPGYFEAMDIPLLAGRPFTWSDTAASPHVAIVSESLARQQWPDGDAIGREIQFGNMDGDMRPMTVVGVVRDVRDRQLDSQPVATLYGHAAQRTQAFSTFAFVVRGPAHPLDAAADAREAVRAVVPEVPVSTRAVDDLVAATYGNQRFSLLVVLLFAAAALLLAISGLYGVSSYAVSSRTREIGVRMVLGADAKGIGGLVLREGLWLVAIGSVAGVIGVVTVARLFASALADLGDLSPLVVALAVGVVGVCALAACLVPARRAARLEPATAIREA
jgi:putative ABC transport system permease protein